MYDWGVFVSCCTICINVYNKRDRVRAMINIGCMPFKFTVIQTET